MPLCVEQAGSGWLPQVRLEKHKEVGGAYCRYNLFLLSVLSQFALVSYGTKLNMSLKINLP